MSPRILVLLLASAISFAATPASASGVQAAGLGAGPFPPASGTLPIKKMPTVTAAMVQSTRQTSVANASNAPARMAVIAPALAAGRGLKPYAGK